MRRVLMWAVWAGISTSAALGDDAPDPAKKAQTPPMTPSPSVRDSVVQIFTTQRTPDLIRPWSKQNPREATGSGVVIAGKRILTNAHVVLYASQVFVQAYQSGDKLPATVETLGIGIDLAVLKVEDESFFDTHPPLKTADELPEIREAVEVYGYPQGGNSQSVTKGIVSRVEYAPYFEDVSALRIQVDAAINPGNSGGPAVIKDAMIGLTFSKFASADNIGYIIPMEEVRRFLDDIADGNYEGKPALFDRVQTLENDALRAKLKLDRKTTGVMVRDPASETADYPLKADDVIARIGDYEIDNLGTVKIRDNLRLEFSYLVPKLAKDGKVPLTIVREGKTSTVELPVKPTRQMLIESLNGKYPSYFICGPVVFTRASSEFASVLDRSSAIGTMFGIQANPLLTRRGDTPRFPGEELVIVSAPLFPHRIGKGYPNCVGRVVADINGTQVKNLRHLVELVRDAKGEFLTIRFAGRSAPTLVFRLKDLTEATEEILSDNGVRKVCSDDLAGVWEKKS